MIWAILAWYFIGVVYIGYHLWMERSRPKTFIDWMYQSLPWYQRAFFWFIVLFVAPLMWLELEIDYRDRKQVQETNELISQFTRRTGGGPDENKEKHIA